MIILTPKADCRFYARDPSDDPSDDHDLDYKVVKEAFVENVYQIEPSDFNDSGIFIDIGANIGAQSIFVANFNEGRDKKKPKIRVIAYEPEPHNLDYLWQNLEVNEVADKVTVHEQAIWLDNKGVNISNRGGNSSVFEHPKADGYTEVSTATLEQIFTDNKIDDCDVMKIDIEGAEYHILTAASKETLQKIRYLVLEFDGGHEAEFGPMVANLAKWFGLHILGSPVRGGYIYCRRY